MSKKKLRHLQKIEKKEARARNRAPLIPPALKHYCLLCFDYIIVPILIVYIAHQPNFLHGMVDYFEAGKELACVNEIFLGKIPYLETRMSFGPLNIYLEALAVLVFGKNLAVLRGFYYFGTMATLITGYFIARILCRRRIFSYLAGFALIIETFHPFWASRWGGFRFTFGLLTILCAITFFRKEKYRWAFITGALVSVAFLVSPEIGIFTGMASASAFVFRAVYKFIQEKRPDVKSLACYSAGAAAVLLPFLLYFAVLRVLPLYIDDLFTIATKFMKAYKQLATIDLNKSLDPRNILTYDFKYLLPPIVYAISTAYLLYRIIRREVAALEYSILCLALYGILEFKSAFRALLGPQFQMALQPALIMGAVMLDSLFASTVKTRRAVPSEKGMPVSLVACVVIITLAFSYMVFSEKRFYDNLKGWYYYQKNKSRFMPVYMGAVPVSKVDLVPLTIARARGVMVPRWQFDEIEGVTDHVLSVTKADEAVFTFPDLGIYNFFTNRPCLDRFNIAVAAYISDKDRRLLMEDLERLKPRYIIYGRRLSHLAVSLEMDKELLPEAEDYIRSHYDTEAVFGGINILRRREEG